MGSICGRCQRHASSRKDRCRHGSCHSAAVRCHELDHATRGIFLDATQIWPSFLAWAQIWHLAHDFKHLRHCQICAFFVWCPSRSHNCPFPTSKCHVKDTIVLVFGRCDHLHWLLRPSETGSCISFFQLRHNYLVTTCTILS